MSSSEETTTDRAHEPLDALQGWLSAAPALLLAMPGPLSLVRDDPLAASTASGWTALACLPAAAVLVLRRRSVPLAGLVLFLTVMLCALYSERGAGDSFEAERSALGIVSALVLLLSGCSLGSAGRTTLIRALVLASTVWVAEGLADGARRFSGSLGNSGDLSEAALPGVLLAAGAAAGASRLGRVLALAVVLGYGVLVGLVPVLAGCVALASVGLVHLTAIRRNLAGRIAARSLLLGCLAAGLALGVARHGRAPTAVQTVADPVGTQESAPQPGAGPLAGFEVRSLIWQRCLPLIRDHLWWGVGPGQFAREFPPYRSQRELWISSHGRREPTPVEVEHAHNDWLEGFVELGLVGGSAWVAFLLLALWKALVAIHGRRPDQAMLGAAVLGLLINALFNSPLLYGVASPAAGWPLLGALLARNQGVISAGRRRVARLAPILALVALGLRVDDGLGFVRHGRSMRAISNTRRLHVDDLQGLSAPLVAPLIAEALRARPDSPPALEKRYQLLRAQSGPTDQQEETLARLLQARPHRFGALMDLGTLLAEADQYEQARAAYERAAAVDPKNPSLLRNRLLLAAEAGALVGVSEWASELWEHESVDTAWLERAAATALLNAHLEVAQELLARAHPTWVVNDPSAAFALSKRLEREGGPGLLPDAIMAAANTLFARGHIQEGDAASAARLYRQSLRLVGRHADLPGGALQLRLELAGALLLDARPDEASKLLDGLELRPEHWRKLPEWAGQALLEAGALR